ncbi:MAG: bifunctional oligoribonuclease/PAP phosphatase NrnA [Candidatus Aminicenantes bacterium]|nr:bifunctional oligoribonuclease/PAP phosphatase NrnA [Candidatus Aminicenantes bacterium]
MKTRIAEKIRRARTIAISSHVRPDADSIGSGLALNLMLQQMGKVTSYRNADRAPHPIDQLPGYENIRIGQIDPDPFDLVILLEGGSEERTGQKKLENYFSIHIDHHATSSDDADINWVVPEAAAVGELVYELGLEMKVSFSRDMAFNLYAAIASDTGSFKYSNTTASSLAIAADLAVRGGFAPSQVSDLLFNSNPHEKITMLTRVLSTLELAQDQRVAMIDFQRSFLDHLNLKDIETEDIIAIARSIDSVQVLLFFKEIADDYYRVSIRSRANFSARQIAQTFDGGGHHHAAGFFYRGGLAAAKKEILALIQKQLS